MAKILIHTCCAPCLIAPYTRLKEAGHQLAAFWYNPNIHPLLEYRKRRDTLRDFAAKEGFPLFEQDDYGLVEFLQNTLDRIDERCEYCYTTRLEACAQRAGQEGYEAFSTTLLYSRYQKHDRIIEICEELARRYHLSFFYEDWRQLWQEGIRLSKAAGMYRQQYCGCIFSEKERYSEQIRRN
ncbi:MAG: epoxyqueuosine reductase QueH [Candidatus Cloacimonetes bacterium]|nr:epoxyqueuosine reductase QueH [Candidatus Cloacimonadota bacterium]MDD2616830.1 epoxyqueuosine reductase QueH [Candidatus Cloacimonadota bacterium]MDD3547798.1 epoxyqueuosine reductase QueH [Candidatus Cloacimonadota bacterium]